MKRILFSTVFLSGLMASAAVSVAVSRAQQRFPWNGLVDVDFALSGTTDGTGYRLDLALVDGDHEYPAATFKTEPVVVGDGAHRVTWDFGKDHPEIALTNVTVRLGVAPLADTDPLYLVFDLSEGPTATSYPHRYTMMPPNLEDDTCRTTELWMRRIPAGQFTMGWSGVSGEYSPAQNHLPPHQVILSKPYYLAVFEMTQGQYAQLTGEWPSFFSNVTCRATRPVETLSYGTLRGTGDGWYANPPTVTTGSKFAVWQGKFGFPLDFPTEAQWEHACRAGTHAYTYDVSVGASVLGRNNQDTPTNNVDGVTAADVGGTAKVGSYRPNPWGLYDMMGNVQEFVGDGHPYHAKGVLPDQADFKGEPYVDPRGPTPECAVRLSEAKVTTTYTGAIAARDGSWKANATSMLVYQRAPYGRSDSNKFNTLGFRLCITCD